jgi:hypothetical protein
MWGKKAASQPQNYNGVYLFDLTLTDEITNLKKNHQTF